MRLFSPVSLLWLLLLSTAALGQSRQRLGLNAPWRFAQGDFPQSAQPAFNAAAWQPVSLPHTWNAADAFTHRMDYYRGPAWYRRSFHAPAQWQGQSVRIWFEGANQRTEAFLNGKRIGEQVGGYTAFSFEVSPHLLPGQENWLAVRVDNSHDPDTPPLSADFTFYGGIYRDVYIEAAPALHFATDTLAAPPILVKGVQMSRQEAKVQVSGAIHVPQGLTAGLLLRAEVLDHTGAVVARAEQTWKAGQRREGLLPFTLTTSAIRAPRLWSPADPYRYSVRAGIYQQERKATRLADEVTEMVGIRWAEVDVKNGFRLNGEPIVLVGSNRHQDMAGRGNALTDLRHEADAQLMKDMGMNFLRIAHYPQDPALLEACDRLGIIVWEEIPIVNEITPNQAFFQRSKTMLREMMRQHHNYASVLMWGYMNEMILGTMRSGKSEAEKQFHYEQTVELAKQLEAIVRREDPERLTVIAFHGEEINNTLGFGEIPMIVGWNLYQGWYGSNLSAFGTYLDDQHRRFPSRPLIISEYGAGSDARVHSLEPEQFDFSMEYQQRYLESYMEQMKTRSYVVGSAIWNFVDFGSNDRQETMPRVNNKGVVFADRRKKDAYHYYRVALRPEPAVYIAAGDWPERVARKASPADTTALHPVKVYANTPRVELFCNGRSLGVKEMENFHAVWQVPLSHGRNQLEAQGLSENAAAKSITHHAEIHLSLLAPDLRNMQPGQVVGLNAGSRVYYTEPESGFTWEPDRPWSTGGFGYIGGTQYRPKPDRPGIQSEIAGTEHQPLYQTMREGLSAYRFEVPPGLYEVELLFAQPDTRTQNSILNDIGAGASGVELQERSFGVLLNNRPLAVEFNPLRQTGLLRASSLSGRVQVSGTEGLLVELKAVKGATMLNAIRVRRVQ